MEVVDDPVRSMTSRAYGRHRTTHLMMTPGDDHQLQITAAIRLRACISSTSLQVHTIGIERQLPKGRVLDSLLHPPSRHLRRSLDPRLQLLLVQIR